MKAICFMQEVKEGDLTIREQMLVCRRALRKLRWPCVLELFAQAGSGRLGRCRCSTSVLWASGVGRFAGIAFALWYPYLRGKGWKLDRARRTSLDGPPRI